jgi:hypothetical protein
MILRNPDYLSGPFGYLPVSPADIAPFSPLARDGQPENPARLSDTEPEVHFPRGLGALGSEQVVRIAPLDEPGTPPAADTPGKEPPIDRPPGGEREAQWNDPFDPDSPNALPEWELLKGEDVATTPGADESDPLVEVKRTRLAINCARDAYYNRMQRFPYLTEEQQQKMHRDTKETIGSESALNSFCCELLTHDIGKNERVKTRVCECTGAGPEIDHDEVYRRLVLDPALAQDRHELLPSHETLPEEDKQQHIKLANIDTHG